MARRAAIGGVIGLVLVAAIAMGDAVRAQRPPQLVVLPTRSGGVAAIELPTRERARRVISGAVVSVHGWRPGELSGWWIVEIAGAGAAGARSFAVRAASQADVPLRAREQIRATIDCTRGGWHFVCDGVVESAAGELLFASSGSGTDGLAPGWHLVGHSARGVADGDRFTHTLEFEHAGGRMTTRVSGWNLVRASDGQWLVSGSFSAWNARRQRVPEAVDYTMYSITRVRPAAARLPAPAVPSAAPSGPAGPQSAPSAGSLDIACVTDSECAWDDPCVPQRCLGSRAIDEAACEETAPAPGSCGCIGGRCTLRPSTPSVVACTTLCAVDPTSGICAPSEAGVGLLPDGVARAGAFCSCDAGPSGRVCTYRIRESVPCRTALDCGVGADAGGPVPTRARPRRRRAFRPCEDGELAPTCVAGECRLVGFDC